MDRALGTVSREWHAFWNAVMFFTRIRVPRRTKYSPELQNLAAMWFPLVGAVIGVLCSIVGWLVARRGGTLVGACVATAASILITGAFHEDGLADTCDGLGSAGTADHADPARALSVMKDSRIGTYGAVGTVVVLVTKVAAISALTSVTPGRDQTRAVTRWLDGWSALAVAHSVSRATAISLLATLQYVRADAESKAKPLATELRGARLVIALGLGLIPLAVFAVGIETAVAVVAAMIAVHLGARRYFRRRLGGYTGDCLGATQQIAELVCYLTLLLGPR